MTRDTNRFGDDNLQLIDFTEEDDYLIAFPYRDSLEDLRLSVTFDSVNGRNNQLQSESVDPRRQSFMRKSLAWDSAFFTSAGVLNPEELFLVNKGFKKAESNQPSLRIQKDCKRSKAATSNCGATCSQSNAQSCSKMNICSQTKAKSVQALKSQSPNLQGTDGMTKTKTAVHQFIQDKVSSFPKLFSSRQTNNSAAVEKTENVKIEYKTRKAGTAQDFTVSKRSRSGDLSGLPKSTYFTTPTTVHRSYESSSSASSSKNLSKSIKRKVNPKNMKLVNSPSSVHISLSSTCSSSTSPASSIDGWLSESLSSTTITHHNTIPMLDFKSQTSVERKFISQNATRSSIGTGPFSGGSKRKMKASGLRMPSPKIGFFDEESIFNRSMQDRFEGQSPSPNENELNKNQSSSLSPCVSTGNRLRVGRRVGSSCSKLKPDGKTSKDILKMNLDRKRLNGDRGSFEAEKENVCSFEDEVNGLSRQLEVIDLEKDVVQVKGQRIQEVLKPGQLSVVKTDSEHSTPCSRTPLAKKKFGK